VRVPLADLAERVWYGRTVASRGIQAALSPFSAMYSRYIDRLNAAHDATPAHPTPIPCVSVGNLSVGGTGKTPVSAWFAAELLRRGASTAVVLRGYGDDEVLVHRLLNPDVRVHADPDRARAIRLVAAEGADVAILDDAFQRRAVARVADVVLLSADRWGDGAVRLLPAGPFREPLRSLTRATAVIVTVKAASDEAAAAVRAAVRQVTNSAVVTVDLAPASLVAVDSGISESVRQWHGKRVLAVSGIGDPTAFAAQLRQLGIDPVPLVFADHHRYDAKDVARIVAAAAGLDGVICTLKDAVKLDRQWSSSVERLWYLSQTVIPRDGASILNDIVESVLQARRDHRSTPDLQR
jgi:tetraacyldisaccharide 4'-kinase